MMGRLVEVCRRRGLKVNADKSKVIGLGGERDWSVRHEWMVHNWSKCHSSNIWVHMLPNVAERW